MKIITISREFGSGGRELGKRIADKLGFDYYDSEIISAVAKNSGMDAHYVESTLDNHGWQDFSITFGGTIHSVEYLQASKIELLVQQRKVIESIAALGKDCVIIGRNADVILKDYHPFNIFVCADKDAKLKRCRERAREEEHLTDRELLRKMKEIDRGRAHTRDFLSGTAWGDREAYHLIVNTGGWDMKKLADAVTGFAEKWFESKE
ncbi:MAG: cytidylate kinase-like family protein [Clostridia bacterium]|jgi:cytidylate kinase|nr:cytidylate kinase-like family protein [Clostridia bacterium]MBR2644327.1 cytidylate kinase-like family protein [Clostridia bacterium]MBR3130877.1 cytidylate kinase-like family protein [Clostridia bacterium]